jgi:hypothetical protein
MCATFYIYHARSRSSEEVEEERLKKRRGKNDRLKEFKKFGADLKH